MENRQRLQRADAGRAGSWRGRGGVVAELVYPRVSTDEQSTQRQTHLLADAGLVDGADGVRLFCDPATSSKIPALDRAAELGADGASSAQRKAYRIYADRYAAWQPR